MADVTEKDRETARELAEYWYSRVIHDDGGEEALRNGMAEAISEALASARSEASGGWIPVEERMPEPTDADDPGRFVLVVRVSHGERDVCKTWWSPGARHPFEMYRVTHWMPIPALPGAPHE